MSEQQRIFLAVLLCTGIFVGWQLLQPPPPPQALAPAAAPAAALKPATEVAAQRPVAASAPTAPAVEQQRDVSTPLLQGTITNVGAGFRNLHLVNYFEATHEAGVRVPLALSSNDVPQAQITWDMPNAPVMQFVEGEQGTTLAGSDPAAWRVEVQVTPRADAYALDYVVKAQNTSSQPQNASATVTLALSPHATGSSSFDWHTLWPGAKPAARIDGPLVGICDVAGKQHRETLESLRKAPVDFAEAPGWLAIDREHFVIAVMPQEGTRGTCHMNGTPSMAQVAYQFAAAAVPPNGTWEQHFTLYAGPKRDASLSAVAPALLDVVDYDFLYIPLGFLARPMVYLLNIFHGWVNSWGGAIILLTVVIKLIMFPVTFKSMASMRRVQDLKPDLDRIKKQFPNDTERQQREQLNLYREKGVNPMGGCLPMLLQMPVWVALWRMLSNAVDLYQQPFMWIADLTLKEPIPFMALALGGLQLVQQKLTPMAQDNPQARMMGYLMPVFFTFLMITLPSGLVLYSLVNIILTIIQQLAINKFASGSQGRT